MAAPDNTTPPRPASVPAGSRWDPGFEWVHGGLDADGRRHGRYRSWTRAGALHAECDYDHGRVHGYNITYHPDGTPASEAEWQHGVIMDSVFHRCAVATPEPFAGAAPGVWSVRYCTRDGKTNYTIRYFARDGSECGPDGEPLPSRPDGVGAGARWFADIERWVEGAIERGTNAQVGRWRWWSASGALRHEELRDGKGNAARIEHYTAEGVLEQRIVRDDDGEERDYFADGVLATRYRTDTRGRELYRASYQPDGTLIDEAVHVYDGDALVGVTERGPGGAPVFDARRRSDGTTLSCVLFAAGGALPLASGELASDRLVGRWSIFDRDGALRRELDTTRHVIAQAPTGDGLAGRLAEALLRVDATTTPLPSELAGIADAPWPDELPARIAALVASDPLVREHAYVGLGAALADPALAARALPYLARLLAHASFDQPDDLDRVRLLEAIYEICTRTQGVSIHGSTRLVDRLAGADAGAPAQTRAPLEDSGARAVSIHGSTRLVDRLAGADAGAPAQTRAPLEDSGARAVSIHESTRLVDRLAGADAGAPAQTRAPLEDSGARAAPDLAAALDAAWPAIFSMFGRASYAERNLILATAKLARVAAADLMAIARTDPDPAVRTFAFDRVTELPSFTVDDARASLADRDSVVRAAAAIAVGQRRGAAANRDVVRVLDEVLRTWRDLARRFAELPHVDRHILVAAAEAAAAIGTPDARSLARELCVHLDELDPRDALAYGNALLGLAFGTGERPFAKRFVEILDTVAKSVSFWVHEHDAAALLRARGLPATRLAIGALVAELGAAHDPEAVLLARLGA